ncbi:MAG: peptidoglycan DD-metalloendopeptidase family protein, partial [Myxococcota bacterium]
MLIALLAALASSPPTSRSVMSDLERLDRTLTAAEAYAAESELRRQQLDDELATLQGSIAATRVRQGESFERFRRRVQALNRMPSGARFVLLGSAASLADYLQSARVLRWVARHDVELQHTYVSESTRLRTLQGALQRRRTQLEASEREAREQRDEIASRRQERLELLQAVASQRDLAERAANERSVARRELAEMVKRLTPAGTSAVRFANNRGRLPWPVAGTLRRKFGETIESDFGTMTAANGIDIDAAAGSSVQAIADGDVVYADWLRGYGLLVIVDHGEGYHAVMAHLAKSLVAVGDHVSQ